MGESFLPASATHGIKYSVTVLRLNAVFLDLRTPYLISIEDTYKL